MGGVGTYKNLDPVSLLGSRHFVLTWLSISKKGIHNLKTTSFQRRYYCSFLKGPRTQIIGF